jgi:hypothetical protein
MARSQSHPKSKYGQSDRQPLILFSENQELTAYNLHPPYFTPSAPGITPGNGALLFSFNSGRGTAFRGNI